MKVSLSMSVNIIADNIIFDLKLGANDKCNIIMERCMCISFSTWTLTFVVEISRWLPHILPLYSFSRIMTIVNNYLYYAMLIFRSLYLL